MPRIKELKSNYISKTIKKWLIDADMNQQELAEAIAISPQSMSYKIKNNAFSIAELMDIIEALDVSGEEIVKALKK